MAKQNITVTTRDTRTTVFVIGAGLSAELGYPLTNQLLPRLFERSRPELFKLLNKFVKFHHPGWDGRAATMPDIESLLTELTANEELLPTVRPAGTFNSESLASLKNDLLLEISSWFHEIHGRRSRYQVEFVDKFIAKIDGAENPVLVSFNWDYELDRAMFSDRKGQPSELNYGVEERVTYPVILKPHGSLNWFAENPGKNIKEEKRLTLYVGDCSHSSMICFLRWRGPRTGVNRSYVPWIVPPTHWKKFTHPMMLQIWKRCVDALSVARQVYFLGYSSPAADWHARYIFRCGFHNQIKGLPKKGRDRYQSTGVAEVTVINPDQVAFKRIEELVGNSCSWKATTVGEWIAS